MHPLHRPFLRILSRGLHISLPLSPAPPSTASVPDVTTFLSKIGRDTAQHASKFTEWGQFFGASSAQLKAMGIEPARTRRYIIGWREKFRTMEGKVELAEHKRGRKVDGGERRRKMVRAKRYQEERKVAAGTAR